MTKMSFPRQFRCAGTFLAAAILTWGGCAGEAPVKPAGLEQKIEAARTRADHREIAAVYARQAGVDKEAVERHRGLARAYERGWVWSGPPGGSASRVRGENQSLAAHCENLARRRQRKILRWRGSIAGSLQR